MAKEASLDDCLKLLKGDNDEQRLVGLLLVTKFVKGDDIDAVRKLFDAIGFQFINRLIRTGSGQVGRGHGRQESYLYLALSILAAFCRLPELASSDETIAKVPVLVTTIASKQDEVAVGDCYECLLAIGMSSEKGLRSLLQCGVLPVVAHQLHDSAADAAWIPVALKLFHPLLVKCAADNKVEEYAEDLTYVIPPVAKQFSFQQDIIKFEALSILYSLLVSDISAPIRAALGDSARHSTWPTHARTGVGQILHSCVAVEQKYLVLELAGSIVELVGETWLIATMEFPGQQRHAPPDRFFLLMVETLRVETAVLLNEVAQMAFDPEEGPKAQTSKEVETAAVKRLRLMKCFALLEYIISIVSTQEEGSKQLDESTLQKTIVALDEVVGNVLQLLEDAQAHHQSQGDVLLASVRIVGRYLAEAPAAHKKRSWILLNFLLSVSSESDNRPFLAIQFLLPYLTQVTLDLDGCKAVLVSGSHLQIVVFLRWAVQRTSEAKGSLVDICDILLNLLTTKYKPTDGVNVEDFVPALPALVIWVGHGLSKMENVMAASVCTSVLILTNEGGLRNSSELGPNGLHGVFQVIIRNVEQFLKGGVDDLADEDLLEIVLSGSVVCVSQYPSFKQELRAWVQQHMGDRCLSHVQDLSTNPSLLQLLAVVLRD